MIPASYKPKKKFMQLAIAEAKRARDRGDYPIGAVITRLTGRREVVIASAGNRVKTSGSSIKHVELETLKYVSSGYGRYLPNFVLYSTLGPCAMCADLTAFWRQFHFLHGAFHLGLGANVVFGACFLGFLRNEGQSTEKCNGRKDRLPEAP
jgi:tRNA(Arg) A34 adenosine deaminase TadA